MEGFTHNLSFVLRKTVYDICNNKGADQLLPHMSLVMRKLAFCVCENKDADQLRGNREADQRLCFRYIV